jgi:arylsulfatase
LLIDGAQVGEGVIANTVPAVIETSGEGLCCGYDSGLPVTPDYEAPFRFTGTLLEVVVQVDAPALADPDAQLRAAWNDQ